MPSPLLLMPCIIPTVNEAEGYDDETSESNFVAEMHEALYHCCLMHSSLACSRNAGGGGGADEGALALLAAPHLLSQ
jgi:hypothetical protein